MPIHCPIVTKRISQQEFKLLASEVMGHVFDIHNDFGRFFDEVVYKKELADRMSGVVLELEVIVTHGTFSKTYYVDVLINSSGLFEFKAADAIHPRHRGQTLNYLLLLDLAHGKVINMRPESVGHEFVNCPARLADLRNPQVVDRRWLPQSAGASALRDILMPLIADWGAGLETSLYEEALTHFLGGDDKVLVPVPVIGNKGHLADQRMRLLAPNVAFKFTALQERLDEFESQARRLLRHTSLQTIHWVNITQTTVQFVTLT
ncbi:GxxExxY protein [Prosthecobacter sp.]|uniref:GxxExxY protein n=1 Tax=Prosthecobacter sp. TaxID=1965333 RepID=UPI002ABC6DAD|nr:GxxExxY protein [Prosthecobacter sp.]MDZ4401729.1 GxxExxY protein [Prosthecobacter sp.]